MTEPTTIRAARAMFAPAHAVTHDGTGRSTLYVDASGRTVATDGHALLVATGDADYFPLSADAAPLGTIDGESAEKMRAVIPKRNSGAAFLSFNGRATVEARSDTRTAKAATEAIGPVYPWRKILNPPKPARHAIYDARKLGRMLLAIADAAEADGRTGPVHLDLCMPPTSTRNGHTSYHPLIVHAATGRRHLTGALMPIQPPEGYWPVSAETVNAWWGDAPDPEPAAEAPAETAAA